MESVEHSPVGKERKSLVARPQSAAPRAVLKAAAEQLRHSGHVEAAAELEQWREERYPPRSNQHRWERFFQRKTEEGYSLEKVCLNCGLEDQYRPLGEDGRWRGAWVWPDGRTAQQSLTPTPPCTREAYT